MFGLFVIEAGSEPVPVLDREGKPLVYKTGSDAAQMAARFAAGNCYDNSYEPLKCQPRRLASDAWKARELGRFADGSYVPLPWADLPSLSLTADHFAHVSTVYGAKIAYTVDAAKGAGDLQTRMKPGKYLAAFYRDVFDAPTIARMAAEFATQFGEANALLFADDADGIERVYVNGPHSCMAHAASHFSSSIHPVRIYAAGDLAVAYMEREGRITARALCWPDKKLYGRVYGDETRLTDLLESAAYISGDLEGARMLRIEEGAVFVMPYIDGSTSARDDGEHLILGGCGVCGSNQNGLSGANLQCHDCDTDIDEDDCHGDENGCSYCDDCYSERYRYCERLDEECARDTMSAVITSSCYSGRRVTQSWGERAVEHYAFECEGSGDLYANELKVELADGTVWSQDYVEEHGTVCDGSGDIISCDDAVTMNDGDTWSQDWFDDNGIEVDGVNYAKGDEPTDDTEEALEASPASDPTPYRYRWMASPTFACEAQLTMTLAPPPIQVGGWVVARKAAPGEFTIGARYQVEGLTSYDDRLSVVADDKGAPNGWAQNCFAACDAPAPVAPLDAEWSLDPVEGGWAIQRHGATLQIVEGYFDALYCLRRHKARVAELTTRLEAA